jgi:predicted TIM-barrel fold metal-dependent hydrolase
MIIDAHSHLGRLPGVERTADALLREMDAAGADRAIVFSFAQRVDNEAVLESARRHPDRLVPFAVINPWLEDAVDSLARSFDAGARGLKLHPIAHGFPLDRHDLVDPLLDLTADRGLPVIAHCTADPMSVPNCLGELARTYPGIPFLMAHMGHMYDTNGAIATARRWPNVYLETSGAFYRSIRKAIREVGPDRVVMGSNSPTGSLAEEREKLRLAVDDLGTRAAVEGGTLERLLFGAAVRA